MSRRVEELTAIVERDEDGAPAVLRCPKPGCGSTDLQAVWDMPVVCPVEISGRAIVVRYEHQRDCPDGAGENTYECAACSTSFELPDDVEITEV